MSLDSFLAARDGLAPPNWQNARAISLAPEVSWGNHARGLEALHRNSPALAAPRPEFSLLDLKIALAEQILESCDLCPHDCRVNRRAGKVGFCGVADETALHWEGVLHGEEIELVPSHETFLSGCTMRCAFCYSHKHITNAMSGRKITPDELAACVQSRRSDGATNWNVVGGEPTVHLAPILRALRLLDEPIPLVWNSNLYANPRAMELLDGVVDLYLGDIHFGNDDCAQKLGKIPDYFASVTRAFERAALSGASVIIRHLMMPGHLECCARPAMAWAKKTLPDVPFHLMFQYLPDFRATGDPILGRPLSPAEIERGGQIAREIGVRLYQETAQTMGKPVSPISATDGGAIDIVIHGDGRVAFTRLSGDLLAVAAALNGEDRRLQERQLERGRDAHFVRKATR